MPDETANADTLEHTESEPLLPVRMLNEFAYCPRLFALEWMNDEWADSSDTVEGRTVHRRVDDAGRTKLPDPGEDPERPVAARSVYLGDPGLRLVAKIDLVEAEGGYVMPVDYKRGHPPKVEEGAWEPERVQVCAQALLLRAHGYRCGQGIVYFAGGRRRVDVWIDDALVATTLKYRDGALETLRAGRLPPPLMDSPKCPRCSLVGICLPDEQNLLRHVQEQVRPLIPPRDDGVPLYVQLQGGRLSKSHDEIVILDRDGEVGRARFEDTTRVVVLGNVSVTTPLLRELASRDIPVAFHSFGGWWFGSFLSTSGHNVLTRIAQHRKAADPSACRSLARGFVHGKILNARVMLRRNGDEVPHEVLQRMKELADEATHADSLERLLGIEGGAARLYFGNFPRMIKAELREEFLFEQRNRRPPRDPVNALLSFAYAVLAREFGTIVRGIGLDPYVGFYHQPRPGRPALALDLMEEFRPIVADSAVINAINNGVVQTHDFTRRPTGVALHDSARKRFIQVYERRLDELATHPTFGTRLSYRRILEVQARLLGKVLLDELDAYPEYRVR